MNYEELKHIIEHIKNTCKCVKCKQYFKENYIDIIACTRDETLIELFCDNENCTVSTIVTASLSSKIELNEHVREHKSITKNDILDMKNFLNKFDGDFKKIFKGR